VGSRLLSLRRWLRQLVASCLSGHATRGQRFELQWPWRQNLLCDSTQTTLRNCLGHPAGPPTSLATPLRLRSPLRPFRSSLAAGLRYGYVAGLRLLTVSSASGYLPERTELRSTRNPKSLPWRSGELAPRTWSAWTLLVWIPVPTIRIAVHNRPGSRRASGIPLQNIAMLPSSIPFPSAAVVDHGTNGPTRMGLPRMAPLVKR
jgi:hypothetical protein